MKFKLHYSYELGNSFKNLKMIKENFEKKKKKIDFLFNYYKLKLFSNI